MAIKQIKSWFGGQFVRKLLKLRYYFLALVPVPLFYTFIDGQTRPTYNTDTLPIVADHLTIFIMNGMDDGVYGKEGSVNNGINNNYFNLGDVHHHHGRDIAVCGGSSAVINNYATPAHPHWQPRDYPQQNQKHLYQDRYQGFGLE